jgi:Fe-S-cluster-containing hydrogenase component 2
MIIVHPEKCTGCVRCEVNCSFFRTGRIGRIRSRVKVVKQEEAGIDFPVMCIQCAEHYCTRCPEAAIGIGIHGEIIVSPTQCDGCGACRNLCPIGAIELIEDIPYVCDLCGGNPKCVEHCNTGALEFKENFSESVSLKSLKGKSRGMDPEAKRRGYVRNMTDQLRKEWMAKTGE